MIECSFGPSGVPSCSLPIHERNCGSSLIMENGSHVSPPSSERKRPCGEVPAYQAFGSLAWHGVSQNVCLTVRPVLPSGTLAKAGGFADSFQVLPRSVERKMVGPRWPVLADANKVRPSRGSSTM